MKHTRLTTLHFFALLFVLLITSWGYGQSKNTENTLKLDAKENQSKVNIEAMQWLSGAWLGSGFGGTVEEVWSVPRAGGMMGMFQMIGKDGVVFYEMCQIVEQDGSLILKLKHFNKDLTGWETKDETVDFPLVKIEGQTAWFEGLTYQRKGDKLHVWVALENNGSISEGALTFTLTDIVPDEK